MIKSGKSYSYWLARFNRKMSFHFPRVVLLISDRSVWHNGKQPGIKRFPITGFLLFRLNCAGVNVYFDGLLAESAYSSTFHKAIEFSLKKLGKPKLELRREQYDAIRAICFERKDALAVLPTGFRKSLIYREFLTTFEAAVSLNVIILLCLLCHPEAGS